MTRVSGVRSVVQLVWEGIGTSWRRGLELRLLESLLGRRPFASPQANQQLLLICRPFYSPHDMSRLLAQPETDALVRECSGKVGRLIHSMEVFLRNHWAIRSVALKSRMG